tara:strand:- start:463 stop:690 length:228 start_codon:yes stop_codon:yes gene_type:complete
MAKDWKCSRCGKRWNKQEHVERHIKDFHTKRGGEAIYKPREPEEPSMADLMIDAQIAQACGEPVEDWLADMLPDD